ncbi:Alpha/Beta hydrolase protein [Linnemannia elongata]|nr:Alpha/Beta hydrolase protein [Linnemannia elongata]
MQIKFLLPPVLLSLTAATLCSAVAVDHDPLAVTRRLKPIVGNVTTPDGTVLSYRLFNHTQPAYANATPVIFVGGTGQVQTDWDTVIPHFTKKHPVLAFDNRGIGLSTVTNDTLVTRQNMGNDIHELTKHFGWTHINLVGISMGAIVSNTFMASNFTDVQVDHLVLIAGAYKDSSTGPLVQEIGRWLNSFSTIPPPSGEWKAFIHKLMLACLTPDFINTHPSEIRQFLRQVDQAKGRTYEKFMVQAGAMGVYDLSEALKGYEGRGVKTMVMHGKLDAGMPVEVGRAMSELIGGGVRYMEYPDGGHVLYETNPESVDAIADFLDGEE